MSLQLRRGDCGSIPTLLDGEPGWCSALGKLYIGNGTSNILINGGGGSGISFGNESDMGTLDTGSLYLALDTFKLWAGTDTGNRILACGCPPILSYSLTGSGGALAYGSADVTFTPGLIDFSLTGSGGALAYGSADVSFTPGGVELLPYYWWKFDENSGTYSVNSGTASSFNHADLVAGWETSTLPSLSGNVSAGKIPTGNSAHWINLPSLFDSSPWSVCGWFYLPSNWYTPFGNTENFWAIDSATSGTYIKITKPSTDFVIAAGWTGLSEIGGDVVVSLGAWHHFALTFDGTTATLYFDGDTVDSGVASNDNSGDTSNIIDYVPASGDIPDGDRHSPFVDDYRLYRSCLSDAAILSLSAGHEAFAIPLDFEMEGSGGALGSGSAGVSFTAGITGFLDTFTDSNGTAMSSHVANSGQSWAGTGSATINSNKATNTPSGTSIFLSEASMSDGTVTLDFTTPSSLGSGIYQALIVRGVDTSNHIRVEIDLFGGTDYKINGYTYVSGSPNWFGGSSAFTMATNTTYTITAILSGNSINTSVTQSGSTLATFNFTTSTLHTATKIGFYIDNYPSVSVDNLTMS